MNVVCRTGHVNIHAAHGLAPELSRRLLTFAVLVCLIHVFMLLLAVIEP